MQARNRRNDGLKLTVALEAIKGGKTLKEIASDHGVHPVQVSAWKRMFREGLAKIFSTNGSERKSPIRGQQVEGHGFPTGSLQAEHRWMREKLAGLPLEARLGLVEPAKSTLSLRNQCRLLGITRSSLYYRKKPERPENLEIMEKIREFGSRFPDFGVLRMTKALREAGYVVNPKRVRRLMKKLALCMAFLQYLPLTHFFHQFHRVGLALHHGSRWVWS